MSFGSSLSGLNSSSMALDVISNNIANVSTVGFKSAQANFADVYAASLASAGSQPLPGLGVNTSKVVQSFTQGSLTTTTNPLDMAINGKGFFRLNDNGAITYTRNGQFHLTAPPTPAGTKLTDAQVAAQKSILVTDNGLNVTGYLADSSGAIVKSSPQDIVIDPIMLARVTNRVSNKVNLDAGAQSPSVAPFDPNNALTFTSATSQTVYDSSGNPQNLSFYFLKTAQPNVWEVDTTLGTGQATGSVDLSTLTVQNPLTVSGTAGQFTVKVDGGGTVTASVQGTFTNAASLKQAVQSAIDAALPQSKATVSIDAFNRLVVSSATKGSNSTVALSGGTSFFGTVVIPAPGQQTGPNTLTFNANGQLTNGQLTLATLPALNVDLSGSTQYGGVGFAVNSLAQDGYAKGYLQGTIVGSDGVIQGRYSNNQSQNVAQLVLATFANPGGLVNQGNNQWAPSSQSGSEQLDMPGNPDAKTSLGLGSITGSTVEVSNVDLNAQLVNLITQQRNYQANAQGIKAQDQLMQILAGMR
jgi:flagellar hook protein FlgE